MVFFVRLSRISSVKCSSLKGVTIAQVPMEVRAPSKVAHVSNTVTAASGNGYTKTFTYKILDNLDKGIPRAIPLHDHLDQQRQLVAWGAGLGWDADTLWTVVRRNPTACRLVGQDWCLDWTWVVTGDKNPAVVNPGHNDQHVEVVEYKHAYWLGSKLDNHGVKSNEITVKFCRGRVYENSK